MRLDYNEIKSDGIKLLSSSLIKCRYLSCFSINNNPIGDWGVYYILRTLLNRHRQLYSRFPMPSAIFILPPDDPSLVRVNDSSREKSARKLEYVLAVRKYQASNRWRDSKSKDEYTDEAGTLTDQWTDDRSSMKDSKEREVYDDDDHDDDEAALRSVSSYYYGSVVGSGRPRGHTFRETSEYNKKIILTIFRGNRRNRNHTVSVPSLDFKRDRDGRGDEPPSESDDEFSMSEE